MEGSVVSDSGIILDVTAAEEAVRLAELSIRAALGRPGVSGEGVLHVVVMDPRARWGEVPFERAILFERSVGDPATWGADYRGFARAKAALAWRVGIDTHVVQEMRPHLLAPGETLLWGSACRDGLVVAASGAHPWWDEAFSACVLAFLRALSQERARATREHALALPGPPPGD